MKDGIGKITLANGETYEGEWKKGICNGKGVYKYLSGAKYEGCMKRFKREGSGILYDENGDMVDIEWKNDIAKGPGKLTLATGEVYNGIWE